MRAGLEESRERRPGLATTMSGSDQDGRPRQVGLTPHPAVRYPALALPAPQCPLGGRGAPGRARGRVWGRGRCGARWRGGGLGSGNSPGTHGPPWRDYLAAAGGRGGKAPELGATLDSGSNISTRLLEAGKTHPTKVSRKITNIVKPASWSFKC